MEKRPALGKGLSALIPDAPETPRASPIELDIERLTPNSLQPRGQFDELIRFHKLHGIINKLLFGTDWPIHRMQGDQAKWVREFENLVSKKILTSRELERVMGGTFRSFSNLNCMEDA